LSGFVQGLNKALPLSLPSGNFDADSLPTWAEVSHWSGRLTHMAMAAGVAVGVALALHFVIFAFLRRWGKKREEATEVVAAAQLYHAARWAMVAMGLSAAAANDKLLAHFWNAAEAFAVPALTGWVLYALVKTGAELLVRRANHLADDNEGRSRRSRITILSRSIGFVIIFITVALMLLGFPGVRHIGATLIASAGLIGLAVGAAAQPALKSLIAGVQIAVTEPIRIGDFVVIDGERGRVEDIRLSYVVIRTADERRLIVPTVKFLDTSFQNWTRVGGITGAVLLPIKPGFAIGPIRSAFRQALAERPEWDGRTGDLVVSEARVGSVELKLVMSSEDPADLGALNLAMREAMLEWLREKMPEALCQET